MKPILQAAVAAALGISACSPTEYEVRREIVINAPAEVVFEQINDHRNRGDWSPWDQMDPNMEKTYSGPDSGTGAVYAWSGNDSVGTGSLEILKSEPFTHIESRLTFTAPWETSSTILWNFEEMENGTRTEWITRGSLPGYLFWMGQEDMDQMMGENFEKGLAQLKALSEQKAANRLPTGVLETTVAAMNYFYVPHDMPLDAYSQDILAASYDELFTFLGEDAAKVKEPPFAIYHEWDVEKNKAVFDVAIAVDSDKSASGSVKRDSTYSGAVVMRIYEGPYEGTEKVHDELHQYISNKGYEFAGNCWESYVVGPADEPDAAQWVTEIYYPVK